MRIRYCLLLSLLLLALVVSPGMAAQDDPVPPPPPAKPKGPKGCKAKESMLTWKLAEAREGHDEVRIKGLERALANARAWCSGGSPRAKAELDVWEKEQEVAERERDLASAKIGGKPDKIAKREQKLEQARKELEAAKAALHH